MSSCEWHDQCMLHWGGASLKGTNEPQIPNSQHSHSHLDAISCTSSHVRAHKSFWSMKMHHTWMHLESNTNLAHLVHISSKPSWNHKHTWRGIMQRQPKSSQPLERVPPKPKSTNIWCQPLVHILPSQLDCWLHKLIPYIITKRVRYTDKTRFYLRDLVYWST